MSSLLDRRREGLAYRAGAYTALDLWMGVIVTIVAIEAARRVLGLGMAMCADSPHRLRLYLDLPRPIIIGHRGFTARRIIEYVYLTSDGIFGVMADVVASFIIPFVVFGALEVAGVAKFFVDLSLARSGADRGGTSTSLPSSSSLHGHRQWQPHRRDRDDRHRDHTAHEADGLPAAYRCGCRRSRFHRGDDHASRHGRRRVHHMEMTGILI